MQSIKELQNTGNVRAHVTAIGKGYLNASNIGLRSIGQLVQWKMSVLYTAGVMDPLIDKALKLLFFVNGKEVL